MRHVLLFLFVLSLPFASFANNLQESVHVSNKSTKLEDARAKALAMAPRRAFEVLLQKLTPSQAEEIAKKIPEPNLAALVESVKIMQETITAGQYNADVNIRFYGDKVQKLISENQGIADQPNPDSLLIVPLYKVGKQIFIWENPNPWRDLLAASALEKGRGKLVLPAGNARDALMTDKNKILSGDLKDLRWLAERYGTRNVAVIIAEIPTEKKPEPKTETTGLADNTMPNTMPNDKLSEPTKANKDPEPSEASEVRLSLLRGGEKTPPKTVIYSKNSPTETMDALLKRCADDATNILVQATKEYGVFVADKEQLKMQTLLVKFKDSREWNILRKALEQLPGVEKQEVEEISTNQAKLLLYFKGEESAIQQALFARGLKVQNTNNEWIVSSGT